MKNTSGACEMLRGYFWWQKVLIHIAWDRIRNKKHMHPGPGVRCM